MSSFEKAGPGYPSHSPPGVAPQASNTGPYATAPQTGAPPGESGPATPGQRSLGGDIILAAGGLLFFIGSFLTWIFLDFPSVPGLEFGSPCADIADPGFRATCEETFGVSSSAAPTGFSTNAWDLILTSVAAVLMILVALVAAALALRVLRRSRTVRRGLTAVVLVVDVIVINFASSVDFSALGQRFLDESLGDLAGAGTPGLALGVGFWLALGGLFTANLGVLVAQGGSGRRR
ncbi:MAG: hypothetical protein H0U22_00660 [Geodermatophilaceae bacterium]|nr:hypothetical protein [Geodermatophilaceae bacterium]